MDGTIKFNAKRILEKEFRPHGNGYDPAEVDAYLDEIIADYQALERYHEESRKYIVELETNLRKAKEKAAALEVDNAKLSRRLSGVKESDRVSSENIDLLNRISKLETALYQKGVDPTKL